MAERQRNLKYLKINEEKIPAVIPIPTEAIPSTIKLPKI